MKTKSIGLIGILLAAMTVSAQTNKRAKTAYDDDRYNNYDHVHTVNGKRVEEIKMNHHNKIYKAEFVNDKMTSLSIDSQKIPESEWPAHTEATTTIRMQIKLNEDQAKVNTKQAIRNAEQVSVDEQQENRNEDQARLNEIQAKKNAEQHERNDEQAKRNAELAKRNEVQAKRNAEKEVRNKERENRNEEQAKVNAEQAAENERFIKELTEDLVLDKIITVQEGLREFNLSIVEMTVNGVKQSEAIFKKYQEKYSKQSSGGFNYSRDGIIQNN